MDQRDRVPGTEAPQGTQPGEAKPGGQIKPPRQLEKKPRKGAAGIPRRGDGAQPAEAWKPEPSEGFGERRDIETADEPAEQHDRRHHDRGRSDVESSQPV